LNPPGSFYDGGRSMLSGSTERSAVHAVNFATNDQVLFRPQVPPYNRSILELALELLMVLDDLTNSLTRNQRSIGFPGGTWGVTFHYRSDDIRLTSDRFSSNDLVVARPDFIDGIGVFLEQVVQQMLVHCPMALSWRSLKTLHTFARAWLAHPTRPDPRCQFEWRADDIDWASIERQFVLNPPGSEYDKHAIASRELFGTPVIIRFLDHPVPLTVPIRRPLEWRVLREHRKHLSFEAI
jgi:hypothetical protein